MPLQVFLECVPNCIELLLKKMQSGIKKESRLIKYWRLDRVLSRADYIKSEYFNTKDYLQVASEIKQVLSETQRVQNIIESLQAIDLSCHHQ